MIKAIQTYFAGIAPAYIDGALYVMIAVFGAIMTAFSSDESAKYVDPVWLFWIRTITGVASAGLLALKMFRSTTFADHKQQTKDKQQ